MTAGIATPDGQFVISSGRGAITDTRDASVARVRVTPIAPSKLGPVPDGLRPNGNAYRIEMSYQPKLVSDSDTRHHAAPTHAEPDGHASGVALVVGIITAALAVVIFGGAYVVVRKRRRAA